MIYFPYPGINVNDLNFLHRRRIAKRNFYYGPNALNDLVRIARVEPPEPPERPSLN